MRRLDVALCLSSRMRDQLVALGRDPATTPVAAWGPELTYERYTATGDDLVVCAGQTERDPATLLAALRGTGIAAKVYVAAPVAPAGDAAVEVVATKVPGAPPIHYAGALRICAAPRSWRSRSLAPTVCSRCRRSTTRWRWRSRSS